MPSRGAGPVNPPLAATTATGAAPAPAPAEAAARDAKHFLLPIDEIAPNPLQPRTVFQPEKLAELSESIKANGIIQPIIVRRQETGFQIVAGERRWRAAKLAELTEVPVVVQDVADPQLLQLALIENIQREDLNPIETAHAYQRLAQELGLSQEEIGKRTGKDRASIANTIRLLRLPPEVQLLLAEHRIHMGHARAILGLTEPEQQTQLAEKAAAQGMSVRQVESLVQDMTSERPTKGAKEERVQDPNVRAAVEELERVLGTRVRIVEQSEKRGRIEIEYYSPTELNRLFEQITAK